MSSHHISISTNSWSSCTRTSAEKGFNISLMSFQNTQFSSVISNVSKVSIIPHFLREYDILETGDNFQKIRVIFSIAVTDWPLKKSKPHNILIHVWHFWWTQGHSLLTSFLLKVLRQPGGLRSANHSGSLSSTELWSFFLRKTLNIRSHWIETLQNHPMSVHIWVADYVPILWPQLPRGLKLQWLNALDRMRQQFSPQDLSNHTAGWLWHGVFPVTDSIDHEFTIGTTVWSSSEPKSNLNLETTNVNYVVSHN